MDADGLLNGRQVSEGEIIGKVATWGDYENGTSYHMHFNIQVFTTIGWVWVNPYMTLVAAYERLIGGRGTEIMPGDPAPPVPDKPPVILHPEPAPADGLAHSLRLRREPPKVEKKVEKKEDAESSAPNRAATIAFTGGTGIIATNSAAVDCLRERVATTMPHAANLRVPQLRRPLISRRALLAGALAYREPCLRRTGCSPVRRRLSPIGSRDFARARSGAAFRKQPMTA